MRILHTSDWHVGRTLRGRSRVTEHEEVLGEIVGVARRESVGLVLVAGDLFDTAAPTPEAERVVYRALLDLAATGARVVAVAGNHDNPRRLAAVAPLLSARGIHAAPTVARPADGGVLDVTVGSETARIALVPFLSQRGVVRADELMARDADEHGGAYDDRVRAVVGRLCEPFSADTVNLVVAHLMVAGGTVGGGERSAHTIFDYCVGAPAFPASAHYVALGHLHRTQAVPAACPVWYAGSPLQLDFGEAADDKAVLLVEASPGRPARVERVPVTSGRRLTTLRGTLEELEARAGEAAGDHLRVVVRGAVRAGLAEQVRAWFPDAVDVLVDRPDEGADHDEHPPRRLGRSAGELFAEYLEDAGVRDERLMALFNELWDEHATSTA